MLRAGEVPAGVEPCSMKRSMFWAKIFLSEFLRAGSTGFRLGTVPSVEPALTTPALPWSPWQATQLAVKTVAPAVASPVRPRAGPGPPGLEGLGTSLSLGP